MLTKLYKDKFGYAGTPPIKKETPFEFSDQIDMFLYFKVKQLVRTPIQDNIISPIRVVPFLLEKE